MSIKKQVCCQRDERGDISGTVPKCARNSGGKECMNNVKNFRDLSIICIHSNIRKAAVAPPSSQ